MNTTTTLNFNSFRNLTRHLNGGLILVLESKSVLRSVTIKKTASGAQDLTSKQTTNF